MRTRWMASVLCFALSGSAIPAFAQSTCVVDRLTDAGEGSGMSGDLRYCITNARSGEDVIVFAVTGMINLTSALPDLNVSVSIEGPGANLLTVQRDTGGSYRVFTVSSSVTVNISGVTISNGNEVAFGYGGGIFNSATLTIRDSTVSSNRAFYGGGIYNSGTLTISSSTIFGNWSEAVETYGGGILNVGTLTISNSTISGNVVFCSDCVPGCAAVGGGIANFGTLTVTNSTISGNRSESPQPGRYAGGIYSAGTLNMRNSIVAGNTALVGPDLDGTLTSSGYNLIGNSQGGSGFDETDLLDLDPLLGPLQDNGGPTFTHALMPGSLAIDAGDNMDAPDYDQRGLGFLRIVNERIDIGAFEVQQ